MPPENASDVIAARVEFARREIKEQFALDFEKRVITDVSPSFSLFAPQIESHVGPAHTREERARMFETDRVPFGAGFLTVNHVILNGEVEAGEVMPGRFAIYRGVVAKIISVKPDGRYRRYHGLDWGDPGRKIVTLEGLEDGQIMETKVGSSADNDITSIVVGLPTSIF